MNALSLPIIHPAFQNLKRSGRALHLAAGILILAHAITHLRQPDPSYIYLGCLLLVAIDIFILVALAKDLLLAAPRMNLFFRLVEFFFFLVIGVVMLLEEHWLPGAIHILLSAVYMYLFYCEKRANTNEYVAIHHTGITIPALPEQEFFIWSNINRIDAHYDSITIDTSQKKSYHFTLRRNLAFEELDQIHEFCRHYLGSRPS